MVRNTYIYPPKPSMQIISDIFAFTSQEMPRFNSISISGYHIQEAGATADLELAYTLADGVEYLKAGQAAGHGRRRVRAAPVVLLGHRHELLHGGRQAPGRAAAVGEAGQEAGAKNPKSLSLRTHSQTSGWSLTAQDVYNNVVRTCLEAMAATQGHTQSLHTNALDEALALPTDFSARIARNTQLLLQQESGTTRVIDPWGGSAYVEKLTYDLARRAWAHIQEVAEHGGMAQAIDDGIPKLRIEEAAARTQARIDSGRQPVIGVNKYRVDADEAIEVLRVDNADVLAQQKAKLEELRAVAGRRRGRRRRCAGSPTPPGRPPRDGGGATLDSNLLKLAVDAARAKATVGEISDALEEVYGRHAGQVRTISGVYRDEAGRLRARWRRPAGWPRSSRRPRAAVRGSWSPRWARTATTAARRSSPPRSPTSASTSTSARCSRRRRRSPARRWRPTCTSSASPRWPPATSPWCRRCATRSPSSVPTTS